MWAQGTTTKHCAGIVRYIGKMPHIYSVGSSEMYLFFLEGYNDSSRDSASPIKR